MVTDLNSYKLFVWSELDQTWRSLGKNKAFTVTSGHGGRTYIVDYYRHRVLRTIILDCLPEHQKAINEKILPRRLSESLDQ